MLFLVACHAIFTWCRKNSLGDPGLYLEMKIMSSWKKKRNLPDSWCWRWCDHHMLNMEGDSVRHPLHSKEAKNGNSGKEEWNLLWLLKQKSYWLSSWQTGMVVQNLAIWFRSFKNKVFLSCNKCLPVITLVTKKLNTLICNFLLCNARWSLTVFFSLFCPVNDILSHHYWTLAVYHCDLKIWSTHLKVFIPAGYLAINLSKYKELISFWPDHQWKVWVDSGQSTRAFQGI